MPCEQPLKLGKTQPHGLALIVFSAKSTLGCHCLGNLCLEELMTPSLNQDNSHLNSQLTVGRRMKAVLCDVLYGVALPCSPDLFPALGTET